MHSVTRLCLTLVIVMLSSFAWADSSSLLNQAKAANATRYQFAVTNNAELRNTSDNKAFTIWWQSSAGTPNSNNVNTALAQFVPTPRTTAAVSDCLFDWAERSFAQYFSPAGMASANFAQYYFRYFASTATYLAVSAADNHVWVLGPVTGNNLVDVGPVATVQSLAGCAK